MQHNNIRRPQPNYTRQSKKLPIVIKWGDKCIYLGEAEFLKDGSLVFEAELYVGKGAGETIQLGISNFKEGRFFNKPPDTSVQVGSGLHVSLHPTIDDRVGVMHFREHYPGNVLHRREIDWYPVITPFNLLHVFTHPIEMLPTSSKQQTVMTPIDPAYKESLEIVVDIFPRDAETHHPIKGSAEVWGVCPDYLVRISIGLTGERSLGLIYWPMDSNLEL